MTRVILTSLSLMLAVPAAAQQPKKAAGPSPLQVANQQDHKLMMKALGIKSLREGANGMNRNAPNAANYDESKVKAFTLPDPLACRDGTKVTTPEQWWTKRRPEIVEDFDREVYGRVPKDVPKVTWEVTSTTEEKVGDIPVITKRLLGHVDHSSSDSAPGRAARRRQGPRRRRRPRPLPPRASVSAAEARPGGNKSSPRGGATPSSSPTASRPTTARG
jgi:hypothetical protein